MTKYAFYLFAWIFFSIETKAQVQSEPIKDIYEERLLKLKQNGVPFFYHEDIKIAIDHWLGKSGGPLEQMLQNANHYFGIVDSLLKNTGLPGFLGYVPLANTGFQLSYVGEDGSSGPWPLDYLIAKKYGLKVNSYIDERRNLTLSTHAAAAYLWDLNLIYKDWLKAITAFYMGPLKFNQMLHANGGNLTYSEIFEKLQEKERAPIVQFIALAYLMNYYHEHALIIPQKKWVLTDTAYVEEYFSFELIEEITGITADEIKTYNPELIAEVVPFWGRPQPFQLPIEKISDFNTKKDSVIRSWQEAKMPKVVYDTFYRVVDSVTYIEVKPRAVGVVDTNPSGISENNQDTRIWIYYKVKPGDGFYTLADIFDCTMAELKSWNGIRGNNLYAGVTLKFWVLKSKSSYYKSLNFMNATQKRNIAVKD